MIEAGTTVIATLPTRRSPPDLIPVEVVACGGKDGDFDLGALAGRSTSEGPMAYHRLSFATTGMNE